MPRKKKEDKSAPVELSDTEVEDVVGGLSIDSNNPKLGKPTVGGQDPLGGFQEPLVGFQEPLVGFQEPLVGKK